MKTPLTPDEIAEIEAAERAEAEGDDKHRAKTVDTSSKRGKRATAATGEPTTELATRSKVGGLQQYLRGKTEALARWTRERVSPDALIRFALFDYQRSPQLQKCTYESIYLSLIACAQVGLEPGGPKQEAYIVPYWNKERRQHEAQFQLGYRGVITLAKRSGLVSRVVGNVIYEGDEFDADEGAKTYVHHKRALVDRGAWIGAYAYATQRDGELELEVMARDDLQRVLDHATSRGVSPAYRDWEDQMLRKAPIRRLGKRLPLGADFALAMELDAARDIAATRTALEVAAEQPEQPRSPMISQRGTDGLRAALGQLDGELDGDQADDEGE